MKGAWDDTRGGIGYHSGPKKWRAGGGNEGGRARWATGDFENDESPEQIMTVRAIASPPLLEGSNSGLMPSVLARGRWAWQGGDDAGILENEDEG